MNQADYLYEVTLDPPKEHDSPVYIYVLCDPETMDVVYVGSTTKPVQRLQLHKYRRTVGEWVKSTGKMPRMFVIDITAKEHSADSEAWYIDYFINRGVKLLNYKMPDGYRRKWSEVQRLTN